MKTIVRFYTAKAFQDRLKALVKEYQALKADEPELFSNISISVKRVVAAALLVSHDTPSDALCRLLDYTCLPGPLHEDFNPADNPFQSTLGASMRIIDYAKQGSARLNIDVLDPIEDDRRDTDPNTNERYRLTYRQYIHIALLYLHQLSKDNKITAIKASDQIYPFNMKGPGDRVKSQAIEVVDKKLAQKIVSAKKHAP